MVEDTFQKLLEEYNEEKDEYIGIDSAYLLVNGMTPQERLDLTNMLLEDIKSYEDYYKLEDIAKSIDSYLNCEILFKEVNLDIPKVRKLYFPEEKMDEKKIYFEKKLYDLVLHEYMLNNYLTDDRKIAEIFTPIINKRVEKLKQSIVAPQEVMDVIERIDNDPKNAHNPKKYLNFDLYRKLYLLENNYKFDTLSNNLANLRVEKDNIITNLNVNKEAIKKLKKTRRIYTLVGVVIATIVLGGAVWGSKITHADPEIRPTKEEDITVSILVAFLIALLEFYPISIWRDTFKHKDLVEAKKFKRKYLPKLKEVLLKIKELEEREAMNNEVNSIKDSSIVDKELEKNKPTGLNI